MESVALHLETGQGVISLVEVAWMRVSVARKTSFKTPNDSSDDNDNVGFLQPRCMHVTQDEPT